MQVSEKFIRSVHSLRNLFATGGSVGMRGALATFFPLFQCSYRRMSAICLLSTGIYVSYLHKLLFSWKLWPSTGTKSCTIELILLMRYHKLHVISELVDISANLFFYRISELFYPLWIFVYTYLCILCAFYFPIGA